MVQHGRLALSDGRRAWRHSDIGRSVADVTRVVTLIFRQIIAHKRHFYVYWVNDNVNGWKGKCYVCNVNDVACY